MRHETVLDLTRKLSIDEKMVFLNDVKITFLNDHLIFTDITSLIDNSLITIYFSISDNDNGRIQLMEQKIAIAVNLDFQRLIKLHSYSSNYFKDILIETYSEHNFSPN